MLKQFIPLLVMTFFISLFIVMMQFLWRYIDDLVGKGLGVDVIAELFFYAALTMVPTALPLAVLLASLMTFGNLGERLELTAMKSAGISLFRIMKPLIVLMTFIAIGAFFFQNNVLPIAQTKMYTLLFSMRQKSPEIEIPVKSFYDQIPGMNLYVDSKDRNTGTLRGMIIYDITRGIDNSRVILADSGKLSFTEDKTRLFLHLYHGELFENFKDNAIGSSGSSYLPFRRETFDDKQVYFAFDANFNRIDEQGIRSQYVGKNIAELNVAIDSIQEKVDSIGNAFGTELKERPYLGIPYYTVRYIDHKPTRVKQQPVTLAHTVNVDSLFKSAKPENLRTCLNQAIAKARRQQQEYQFKGAVLLDQQKSMRRHQIELMRKFTLSVACLVFFFIGAPLGAIIKKGGIGTPLVISVFLFIVYFIFDNSGYKFAREGKVAVWFGMWMSTMVMLPLGVFFTIKAVGDTQMFDAEFFKRFFARFKRKSPTRNIQSKELSMTDINADNTSPRLDSFITMIQSRMVGTDKDSSEQIPEEEPITPVSDSAQWSLAEATPPSPENVADNEEQAAGKTVIKSLKQKIKAIGQRIKDIPGSIRLRRSGQKSEEMFTQEHNREFDELVEWLSNSSDKHVIALLNQYPTVLNRKTASTVIDVTRRINARLFETSARALGDNAAENNAVAQNFTNADNNQNS